MTHPVDDPILVEVTRGDLVESVHRGAIAVVDSAGKIVQSWGDIERAVYARSAIKPVQALPLLESGAADRFGLGHKEIALACASHHGEAAHVGAVGAWLERAGLGASDLECGAHAPTDKAAADALVRAGEAPCPLHNNCSGKHTGFLTTARHLGEATAGYIQPDHPVQVRVTRALQEMTGLDLSRAPRGTDGCGIPTIGLSLHGMARAMAGLADPSGLPDERREAARRIVAALGAEPLMVDGTGGFATDVMAAGAKARIKTGAEGIFCGIFPELGLGVALKIADGAGRASEVAMGALLVRLGALDAAQQAALAGHLTPVIRNVAGRVVGSIRPVAELLSSRAP